MCDPTNTAECDAIEGFACYSRNQILGPRCQPKGNLNSTCNALDAGPCTYPGLYFSLLTLFQRVTTWITNAGIDGLGSVCVTPAEGTDLTKNYWSTLGPGLYCRTIDATLSRCEPCTNPEFCIVCDVSVADSRSSLGSTFFCHDYDYGPSFVN